MKKIQILQLFKDEHLTFYPDEVRCVLEDKAGYFCGVGWAREFTVSPGIGAVPEGMKKIQPLTNFQDDGAKFYEGEQRFVTMAKAGYFCGLGWALDCSGVLPIGKPDISPKTLDVHDVYIKHVTPVISGG